MKPKPNLDFCVSSLETETCFRVVNFSNKNVKNICISYYVRICNFYYFVIRLFQPKKKYSPSKEMNSLLLKKILKLTSKFIYVYYRQWKYKIWLVFKYLKIMTDIEQELELSKDLKQHSFLSTVWSILWNSKMQNIFFM